MILRGAIYGILASSIWGGMYVVSDVVLDTIPPFTLLSFRLMLGAAVVFPFVWRLHSGIPSQIKDLIPLVGVGFVGFGLSLGAQFVGTALSTAIHGTLITSASPAFIVLFSVILLKEPLNASRVLAVALATIGVLVIVNPTNLWWEADSAIGDLALALAALTWGLYSVLVRMVSRQFDTLVVTFYAFIGGLMLTIPTSVVELQTNPIREVTIVDGLGVLYLGVISTAVAMWLWNRAFALVPAATASLFFFAQPLVGALLSNWLLGQQMTTELWIGTFMIVSGVLIALVGLPTNLSRRFGVFLRYNSSNRP